MSYLDFPFACNVPGGTPCSGKNKTAEINLHALRAVCLDALQNASLRVFLPTSLYLLVHEDGM